MKIDLRKGIGDFGSYEIVRFPDNTLKFKLKSHEYQYTDVFIVTSLHSNEDIILLGLVIDFFEGIDEKVVVRIDYMMYQQDDRRFADNESFGLKFIARFLNSFKNIEKVMIFHPHSDKIELIDKCQILSNTSFINQALTNIREDSYWVIPDSGAFKTQFKQIEVLGWQNFITCMKSRDHETREIKTVVNCKNLEGRDCFIIDDICLGGRTFINIAEELRKKNCGKLYLIVSHGVFNNGIDHLIDYFDTIYTTDSICKLNESVNLKIYKL
jgi:ribose-phosphate pyrophosphokinase